MYRIGRMQSVISGDINESWPTALIESFCFHFATSFFDRIMNQSFLNSYPSTHKKLFFEPRRIKSRLCKITINNIYSRQRNQLFYTGNFRCFPVVLQAGNVINTDSSVTGEICSKWLLNHEIFSWLVENSFRAYFM